MVKFGLPAFLRFGLMVKNSALRFSYNSAFRIRPNGPVRMFQLYHALFFKWQNIEMGILRKLKLSYKSPNGLRNLDTSE